MQQMNKTSFSDGCFFFCEKFWGARRPREILDLHPTVLISVQYELWLETSIVIDSFDCNEFRIDALLRCRLVIPFRRACFSPAANLCFSPCLSRPRCNYVTNGSVRCLLPPRSYASAVDIVASP